ncbi:MAG: sodium:solute symporter family protein [Chloroflexota bacterium]|nr:sodium:solute symporter family protein [Chloroflexota bacterium]
MLDVAIIILYFAGMLAVGFYAYRKGRVSSSDGFFVSGRQGGTFLMVGSLCATFMGSSVVVGMAGRGYGMGLPGAWWLLVGAIGLAILGLFLARRVRGFGLYTLPELVEKQYGRYAGLAASVVIVIAWIAVAAAQIIAAGKILNVLFPSYDISMLMTIAASVFVVYTVLGGQYSIIRTDFVQFGILFVGIVISLGVVLNEAGGISVFTDSLPSEFFSFPLNSSFGWYDLVLFLILTGSTYVVGPDIYSRLFCARDEKVARSSAVIAGLVAVPIAFIIVFIGMGARVLFPDIAPEQAFPTVIQELLPIGVGGLVIAALLAAIMSSADTVLMTTSTILSVDIYEKALPRTNKNRSLVATRIGIVVIGTLALLVALYLKGIISSLFYAYTVFTSGIVIPVIAGFYKDKLKVNSAGALAAIIGGGGTALWVKMADIPNLELLGFGICAILLFGVSWIIRGAK